MRIWSFPSDVKSLSGKMGRLEEFRVPGMSTNELVVIAGSTSTGENYSTSYSGEVDVRTGKILKPGGNVVVIKNVIMVFRLPPSKWLTRIILTLRHDVK